MVADGEPTTRIPTNLVAISELISHIPIGRGGEPRDKHFKHKIVANF